VVAELAPVPLRRNAAVLRPLDLRREIRDRPESVRLRQPAREVPERNRLRRHDLADALGREAVELASAAAWKVRALTPRTPSAASRARISPAALSVNVTARICSAMNAPERPGSRSGA
jgi:hypothetical protein